MERHVCTSVPRMEHLTCCITLRWPVTVSIPELRTTSECNRKWNKNKNWKCIIFILLNVECPNRCSNFDIPSVDIPNISYCCLHLR